MKNALRNKLAGLLTASALSLSITQASVILQIDISDPSNVVFTSTGANAQNNVSNALISDGINLVNLFSSTTLIASQETITGTLAAASASGTYFDELTNNVAHVTGTDLNIFNFFGDSMSFSTSSAALSGGGVADLLGASFTSSVFGDITALPVDADGNRIPNQGPVVIGQYEILGETQAVAEIIGCNFNATTGAGSITFNSTSGVSYQIVGKADLSTSPSTWRRITTVSGSSTGITTASLPVGSFSGKKHFFQVREIL